MKFGKISQIGLVSAGALLVATAFSACSSLTVGFMFVSTTKNTPGQIEVYEVNSESGVARTIPTSPFPSGGRNPLAEAVSPDSQNFYAANNDDNNIVQFGIGNDGKLYPQSTINTPGTFPVSLAMNSAGSFLYVADTLQPIAGCSLANPCPGLIAGYAVTSKTAAAQSGSNGEGSLGQVCNTPATGTAETCSLGNPVTNSNSLGYIPLQLSANDLTVLAPTAINIAANGNYVYVTAYTGTVAAYTGLTTPTQGYLFAFSVGSDGGLTPIPLGPDYTYKGQSVQMIPLPVGTDPVSMASDSASQYLYIADELNDQIDTFSIASGTPSLIATAATGGKPSALTLFNGQYLYVANSLDSTVNAYSVSSGSLSNIGTYATDDNPVAITVDPKNVGYLYTVNFLGNSLSGFKIDPSTGALIIAQGSPYASSAQPTAISGIPHGGTATTSGTTSN
jgi:6-phosphogluconolactonase